VVATLEANDRSETECSPLSFTVLGGVGVDSMLLAWSEEGSFRTEEVEHTEKDINDLRAANSLK
jgi:hypothetical protein